MRHTDTMVIDRGIYEHNNYYFIYVHIKLTKLVN